MKKLVIQESEEAMSTTGYSVSLFSYFPLLKIDGGAIENAFPGGTWERVVNS
ncbi:hypothetical protein [Nostoc edaphicum]|uniref:hypothetical protein n=1 Tax=Nostoc edaphicum TaxID=264686 RepID=UPI001D14CB98|nr:hypothetical protein [Nostoc edaphicum]